MSAVTIVIPHWNRRDLLEPLLKHLRSQSHPIEDVLVVDNGSDDESADHAERLGARVLRLERNFGFARAVNLGIQEVRTEYIAILNNDVQPDTDWLRSLVIALGAHPEAWFATGKLYRAGQRETLDGTFDLLCRGACAWRAGHGRLDSAIWGQARQITSAPLTAVLFRRELFERVGLLDERFESYLEDVEFGVRCALSGHPGIYVPESIAAHAGSATLGAWHPETVRRLARNQVLLIARHYPPGWWRSCGWAVLVAQLLWGAVALRHGAGWPWCRGKWEGIRQYALWRGGRWSDRDRWYRFLKEGEAEIRRLQTSSGYDQFWRFYLALT